MFTISDLARLGALLMLALIPAHTRHDWSGRYALTGHDFPDGDRHAVAVIDHVPGGTPSLRFEYGPPGALLAIEAAGDSLHVDWLVATPGRPEPMEVHLAAHGDSISGYWAMREGHVSGAIEGRRLR